MSYCPHCGAQTQADYGFCIACGTTLGAPAAASASGGALSMPARPLGKVVAPWKVVLLVVVTLGVYPYVLWWRTSREVDAYAGSRAHTLVRVGIGLAIVALVGLVVAVYQVLVPLMAVALEDPTAPIDQESARAAYLANPVYLGASVMMLIGSLTLYAGMWRAWSAIRDDEARRGVAHPLQPAVFGGLLVASAILQVLGAFVEVASYFSLPALILTLWILAAWQARLNDTWRAASTLPPAPTPPAQPPGAW